MQIHPFQLQYFSSKEVLSFGGSDRWLADQLPLSAVGPELSLPPEFF
jgi:hypothetical protein